MKLFFSMFNHSAPVHEMFFFILIFSIIQKNILKGFSFRKIFFLKTKIVHVFSFNLISKVYFVFLKIKRLVFTLNKKEFLANFDQKKRLMIIKFLLEFFNNYKKKNKKIASLKKISKWVNLKGKRIEFFKKFIRNNNCFKKKAKIDLFNHHNFFKTKKTTNLQDFGFLSYSILPNNRFENLKNHPRKKKFKRFYFKEYIAFLFKKKTQYSLQNYIDAFQNIPKFLKSLYLVEKGKCSFEEKSFNFFSNLIFKKKKESKKRNFAQGKPKILKKSGEFSAEFYFEISNYVHLKKRKVNSNIFTTKANIKKKNFSSFIFTIDYRFYKKNQLNLFSFKEISEKEILLSLKFLFISIKLNRPNFNQKPDIISKKNNKMTIYLDTKRFSLIFPNLYDRKNDVKSSTYFRLFTSIENFMCTNFATTFFQKIKKIFQEICFLFFKIFEINSEPIKCFAFIWKFEKVSHISKIEGGPVFKIFYFKKNFPLSNSNFNSFVFWNFQDRGLKKNFSFPDYFISGPTKYYFLECFLFKSSQEIVYKGLSGFFFEFENFFKFSSPSRFCILNFLISKFSFLIGYTGKGRIIWIQGIFFLNRYSKILRHLFWKFLFFFEFLFGTKKSKIKTKIINSSFNFLNQHFFFLNSFY